ncbi:Uncharacterised protein [Candidatus Tiddalikarchaeum anstoanum]|nr:Uncharacterised protein [Candidatus Tiddalikarchaeum anstoanum]
MNGLANVEISRLEELVLDASNNKDKLTKKMDIFKVTFIEFYKGNKDKLNVKYKDFLCKELSCSLNITYSEAENYIQKKN